MIKVNVELSAKWNLRIPFKQVAKKAATTASSVAGLLYLAQFLPQF